jgi:(2Fe-2S) ferredoxin
LCDRPKFGFPTRKSGPFVPGSVLLNNQSAQTMKFEKHVFICANDKAAPKKCCGEAHGSALTDAFKAALVERGVQTRIRAQKTGCLDACGSGPTLVVYPEGIYYGKVQLSDVQEIVDSHLLNNIPVERLVVPFK